MLSKILQLGKVWKIDKTSSWNLLSNFKMIYKQFLIILMIFYWKSLKEFDQKHLC